jgi:hypothetical protein
VDDNGSGGDTLGDLYRQARERIEGLVHAHPAAAGHPVQTCPGWNVGEVVAHLVAVLEDVTAGTLTGPPAGAVADAQIARRAGVPMSEVLDEWKGLSPSFEQLVTENERWPAVMDVVSHEHDIRHALATRGGRTLPVVGRCARQLLAFLRTAQPLQVVLDGTPVDIRLQRDATPDVDEPQLVLCTGSFETLRWRTGRRSRHQLASMDWSGDPGPLLDHLTVFGPSEVDVAE